MPKKIISFKVNAKIPLDLNFGLYFTPNYVVLNNKSDNG